jgi:transcriptional regulator with XRE-family HTH domain
VSPGRASEERVGERIRRLRLERGLTQRQIGGPGASYAYVSRIEAGTRSPTPKALRVMAAKLGVSADYLETGEYRDPLTRLYAVATRREAETLDELALRAGLVWVCDDSNCEWLNREEATRCTACGKLLNPAFRAAMEGRRK